MKPYITLILAAFVLVGCHDVEQQATIYHNGNIITMTGDENSTYAKAIEVKGSTITQVAYTDKDARALLRKKKAKQIDLEGKTLMPSFIDTHSHLLRFAQSLITLDLNGVTSIEEIAQKIQEYINTNALEEGAWIIGFGYDNNLMPDKKHPNREDLDKISTTHPIFITHASGHVGTMNSQALEIFGVDENTPEIEGGVIERYADSKPTGYMEETAFMHYANSIDFEVRVEDMMDFINQAEDIYLQNGITTAQDALFTEEDFPLIKTMIAQNRFNIDIIGFIDLKQSPSLLRHNLNMKETYHGRFKIGGYKIFIDGSPQAKTAWLTEPYAHDGDYKGYGVASDLEVRDFVKKAINEGMQLQAHCNGDAAADQYINAIASVMKQRHLKNSHRAVLIHSQIIREDQYETMAKLGIVPSLFVAHVYHWGDAHIENLGLERASHISASQTALKYGLPFTYHQDTPVIKPNMLESVWAGVNRITRKGVVLGESERITPFEALKAITINAAYQNQEERSKGSFEKGKLADMVILSDNPLSIDPMKIKDIEVLETIKEGKTLYKK